MVMKTIHSDAIVRIDPKPRVRKKPLETLPQFDEAGWWLLCERAYRHTRLVDSIREEINQNPDLINWIHAAQDAQLKDSTPDVDSEAEEEEGTQWLPTELVAEITARLKDTDEFKGMSGRSYTCAEKQGKQIHRSWFATQSKLLWKIAGKRRWLAVVESDANLAQRSNFSEHEIEERAEQVLAEMRTQNEDTEEGTEKLPEENNSQLFDLLFQAFDSTEDVLKRRAIILLLKNGGKVQFEPQQPRKRKTRKRKKQDKPEELKQPEKRRTQKGKNRKKKKKEYEPAEPMTLEERLAAKRVEIERLEKQLLSRLPRGRNLFPDWAFEESLEDLIVLPDPDLKKHNQYYFLVFSLLLHQLESDQNVRFESYLLNSMKLQWRELNNVFHYYVLVFTLFLYASSPAIEIYVQLHSYVLQTISRKTEDISIETEQFQSIFAEWEESIAPKLAEFLREPKSLPYPMKFGYEDIRSWQVHAKGKMFFKINGWGDLIFEVRCNRRQLGLIQTFMKDWQTKNRSENSEQQYTGSFMLLRSIELVWEPQKSSKQSDLPLCSNLELFNQYPGEGFWKQFKLSVHWTFQSDALTLQGLEKLRQRKLESQSKSLEKNQKKLERTQKLLGQLEEIPELSIDQAQAKKIEKLKKDLEKLQTGHDKISHNLNRLQSSPLFDRPDRPLYEGVPNIFVGVLLDLNKHMVVAVVDAMRRKLLGIRNAKSISPEGYKLLKQYFHERQQHSQQRQEDQQAFRRVQYTESALGQQVARLFAKGIGELAQQYKASTIVLPESNGWRDRLYSQLVARAKVQCKGVKKAMALYTKKHGEKLHQWDYSRLSKAIVDRAATDGLIVVLQKSVYEEDAFNQVANLAIAAYGSLNSATD